MTDQRFSKQRFSKERRLRRQRDFERVYRRNAYAADDCLVVRAARSDQTHPRLGVSVSRKVGNAVLRNRWKRLIREAFRQQQQDLPGRVDLVVRPRRGARPDYQAIRSSLLRLAQRLARRLSKEAP